MRSDMPCPDIQYVIDVDKRRFRECNAIQYVIDDNITNNSKTLP